MKKLSIYLVILLMIPIYAFASGWQTSFNTDKQEVGKINGKPVLICTYRVGAGSDYFIKVRMNEFSCPPQIFYNVELNQWSRFPPM